MNPEAALWRLTDFDKVYGLGPNTEVRLSLSLNLVVLCAKRNTLLLYLFKDVLSSVSRNMKTKKPDILRSELWTDARIYSERSGRHLRRQLGSVGEHFISGFMAR